MGLMNNYTLNPQGFDPTALHKAYCALHLLLKRLGGTIEGGLPPLGLRERGAEKTVDQLSKELGVLSLGLVESESQRETVPNAAQWRNLSVRVGQLIEKGVISSAVLYNSNDDGSDNAYSGARHGPLMPPVDFADKAKLSCQLGSPRTRVGTSTHGELNEQTSLTQ
jgi:hypothetical protein